MSAPLWLQSLRRRPLIGVLLFALSTAGVLTSALGPLLVRAVEQSSLADATTAAGPAGSSIAASFQVERGDDLGLASGDVLSVFAGATKGQADRLWQEPQLSVQTTSSLGWRTAPVKEREMVSRVASGEDGCAQLMVVAGRCPTRPGEVLDSTADTSRSGAKVGSTLVLTSSSDRTPGVAVVGVYDPDRSTTLDLLRPTSLAGQLLQLSADPLITTRGQLDTLDLGAQITGRLTLVDGLSAQDEESARTTIDRVKAATVGVSGRLVVFDSQLPTLLDGVDRRVTSASVLILITVVQTDLLTVFALVIALQRLGRARSAEWGIGRLRGMPWRQWLTSIWAEPALALALGLPVGLAGAVAVGTAIVGRSLRAGTPVEWLRWPVLVAAVAAVMIALMALVAVSLRDARRPLIELLQQASDSRRVNLVGVVAQSAVVLLAAAALYQLVAGGVLSSRGSQLALLAPALFAFAMAVVAVRITVVVVRRITARAPRSLTGLVVGRHAARSPSSLSPAIVVAVGVALTVFSTQVLALSVRNQGLRAQATAGADTVLQVAAPADLDLVEAVRSADPTGKFAMAAKEKAASSDGGTSRIVAVDSTRVDAVAPWLAKWLGTGSLAQALHPADTESVMIRGRRVTLTVGDVSLKTSPVEGFPSPAAPPELSLIVQVGNGAWQTVPLGPLQGKSASYRADVPCPDGCRLVGIDLFVGKGNAYQTTFTITELKTELAKSGLRPRLTQSGGWRERIGHIGGPNRAESLTATAMPAGLRIRASDTDGEAHNRAVPTDTDDPLPAIIAPGLSVQPFPGMPDVASGTGLDGQSQLIKVVGRATILPRALDDGVLVDLRNAQALSNPTDSEATSEVWLARDAPATIERDLVALGITVLNREHLDDIRQSLLEQGNTRGSVVAVWIALAGLLTALLTLVGARAADAARRRSDWASLRDAGLPSSVLRRLALVEIAVPSLVGVVVGVTSGILAIKLGAAKLPLVDIYTPGPPLDLLVAAVPLVAIIAGVTAVILAVAALGAFVETRPEVDR